MRRSPVARLGGAGVAAGCAAMGSMLPGAIAAALGAVGVTGSNALVAALSPIAEPLFIASAVLILVAALACSRLVVARAAAGTTLLYLSMFHSPPSRRPTRHTTRCP